ncbi:type VI secretion system baseplate subunit TssG [Oleiagrimonas soli]|uniref:Type VI secretion system protein ImpH n=1 Tax=Oleiagrimonas soli TaxID=1543381 RepID=A0A099CZ17_9GAMM|nr:type VI secretion system baseplate subunit TssG [Oleiagrimonas soli]KGI78275.1 hypothetical protein LF63_0108130 [Oleiagrimonas soli]MBB6183241.1 type VI secretion system protein ImpH [Oleiagrimonas soli]
MATADWRTGESLAARLQAQPASFDFFQWVRLSSWPAQDDVQARERGASRVHPDLRFRSELSAAFPGSEISAGRMRMPRRPLGGRRRRELFVSNFTVLGMLGPMPDSFTEWVRERLAERDAGMAEFLDIFNHRISTLRYELKAASVPAFDALHPEHTRYAGAVGALMGLLAFDGAADEILKQRVPLPRRALLSLAGLLPSGRRSAATAERVLTLYLGTDVRVQPLLGAWRDIEQRDRTHLGRRRLSDPAPLGKRVWINHACVGLEIGPIGYQALCAVLADRAPAGMDARKDAFGRGHGPLVAMVHYLFDRRVDVRVSVTLRDERLPPPNLRLPRTANGSHGLRLGQTAWLRGPQTAARRVSFLIRADDDRAVAA